MKLNSVSAVFFSPAGSTGKVVKEIADVIARRAGVPMREIDFTLPKAREEIRKFKACVKFCPEGAKYFDDPVMLSHSRMLEQHYARRAENEVFF